MSSRKKKANRQRGYAKDAYTNIFRFKRCPNCNHFFLKGETGHFVPPSMSEKGMFICDHLKERKNGN
jgi:hypothetical protein